MRFFWLILGLYFATNALAQEAGEQGYTNFCSSCHQATGEGVPGVFPPLAGHAPTLLAAEGGRDYLIYVLLYGLQGEFDIEGQTYNGLMPPWAQLSDEEAAATLNYILTAWSNDALLPETFEPIRPDEVAAARNETLSPAEVIELRQTLELP